MVKDHVATSLVVKDVTKFFEYFESILPRNV